MKKQKHLFIPIIIASLMLFLNSCSEDVLTPPGINYAAPEVTKISAESTTVLKETSIEISVTALDATGYQWSAEGGTFADASSATTSWTAPVVEAPTTFKLVCTVTNSSGTTKASVTVKAVASVLPDGVAAYWSFDTDFSEEVSSDAGIGGTDVSITNDAAAGNGAALFDGADGDIASALFYEDADAPMGPEDLFTISLWAKTEDEGLGFMFGRSFENAEYIEGAKGLYVEEGVVIFDISWIGAFELWDSEVRVNDGEWHHIVFVKDEEEAFIFVDGVEELAAGIEEWSGDEGTIVTIGSAAEEEGGEWPGTFQGSLDDIRYYNSALSEDDVIAIFEE